MLKNKKKSICCDSGVYKAPAYYATKMEGISEVFVCTKCGWETQLKLF